MNNKTISSQIEELLSYYTKIVESNNYDFSNIEKMKKILEKIQKNL
ncbi:MAG TPA: hypothetical protein PLD77_01060 [Candidatus Dojkabacteria bacterium]|nr:hypothetical protein [Candidatus Dojkabacteria bacterium]